MFDEYLLLGGRILGEKPSAVSYGLHILISKDGVTPSVSID